MPSRPVDPLTSLPFAPIEPDVVELVYRADQGWFLQSFAGFLYFCSKEISEFKTGPMAVTLGMKIQCPDRHASSVYTHIYSRWAETTTIAGEVLQHLCHESGHGQNLKLSACRALCEGRKGLANGTPLDEIKSQMLKSLEGPEPEVEDAVKHYWQIACLDEPPALTGHWTYAVPVPWKDSQGDTNSREVIVADVPEDIISPPTMHAVRYIRPLPPAKDEVLDRIIGRKTREINSNIYAAYLTKVRARQRFVARADLDIVHQFYQPRPQNGIPLGRNSQGAVLIKSAALSLPKGVKRSIEVGYSDEAHRTSRRRKTYQDEFYEGYTSSFPYPTSSTFVRPSGPPPTSSDPRLQATRYHRSAPTAPVATTTTTNTTTTTSTTTDTNTTTNTDTTTTADTTTTNLEENVDPLGLMEEHGNEQYFGVDPRLDAEARQQRALASAEMAHIQCKLDLRYELVHLFAKYSRANPRHVPDPELRQLLNLKDHT